VNLVCYGAVLKSAQKTTEMRFKVDIPKIITETGWPSQLSPIENLQLCYEGLLANILARFHLFSC
jgi:hypothetical protein